MRITLETNYAIKIVELLAKKGEKTYAKTLSDEGDIPPRFCLKILRKLTSEGIVTSCKGAKGGYFLSKKPEDITLRDVVEAVEGPLIFSKCQCPDFSCNMPCNLHGLYLEITQAICEKLDSYNFGYIAGGCSQECGADK